MVPVETLISFLVATAAFAYMPGPAMLYTATQTLARGRQAGWMAAAGIHLGGYVHVIAAAAGLSVLFTTLPTLYWGIKIFGAAYLIWLGIQLFLSKRDNTESTTLAAPQTTTRVFADSAMVEILNPKTALFYLAFLPQFTDVSGSLPVWGQLLLLGTFVNIAFSSADILCVLLASRVVNALNQSTAGQRYAQLAGGTLFIGLGFHLLLNQK